MIGRYAVFFVVASLVMGAAHRYVWLRLVHDVALPPPWGRVATIALVALFVLLMTSFVVFRAVPRSIGGPVMWLTYTWLGVLFFLVLALGATDLVRVVTARIQGTGPLDDPERRRAISRMFAGAAAVLGL